VIGGGAVLDHPFALEVAVVVELGA
jgi:hypothetical protein